MPTSRHDTSETDARQTGAAADAPAASVPVPWQRVLAPSADTEDDAAGTRLAFFLELRQVEDQPANILEATPVQYTPVTDSHPATTAALTREHLEQAPLPATETRLAATVLGLPGSTRKDRHYVRLNGATGDTLLADMLATAPCFLGGSVGLRLTQGANRDLSWQWHSDPDGTQHLQPKLPENQQLLVVGKLWYLDTENAQLGRVDGDAQLARLLAAPALEPEHSAPVAQALAHSALAAQVPLPQVFAQPRHVRQTPIPVLTLCAQTRPARRREETDDCPLLVHARLSFDYAGVRIAPGLAEMRPQRTHGRQLLEIERQGSAELASAELLEQCGLSLAIDTEGLPWEVVRTLPEEAWLFPGTGQSGALEVNTTARWLNQRQRLADNGFTVEYDASFPFEVLEPSYEWFARARQLRGRQQFEIQLGIVYAGERINLLPAVSHAIHAGELSLQASATEGPEAVWYAPVDERRRMPVRVAELRRLLTPLADWLSEPAERIILPRVQAGRLDELAAVLPDADALQAPTELRRFTTRLQQLGNRRDDPAPTALNATLRAYQHDGLNWLNALADAGVGGILADDMGLGKTLQVLAHLLSLRERGQSRAPVLVVAPTTLLPNWQQETARFAPALSVLTLTGPQRETQFADIDDHDLVLTSYALLPRDQDKLAQHTYTLLVLDEAQQVKNPRTHARRAAVALGAPRCLCLTGTPLENHLGELWSQMDLAVPGLLGSEDVFRQQYRAPIEKYADADCQARLNDRLAPFILRRNKATVATELPEKTEVTRRVTLGPEQRQLYDSLRARLAEQLQQEVAEHGIEQAGIVVLDALLKLRQVCCDPRLAKTDLAHADVPSAKRALLLEMLPALLAEGRRVLVFSQFAEMLKLLAADLDAQGLAYTMLTGATSDRAEPVRRFQDGEVPLFLLSLRAGGVGLNLTAADAVVHYDPWWNPAAEAQASDRVHRIGQDKPVFVYRLITADTVEERIEALKARKADLAEAVLAGGGSRQQPRFDQQDLDMLLAPPGEV